MTSSTLRVLPIVVNPLVVGRRPVPIAAIAGWLWPILGARNALIGRQLDQNGPQLTDDGGISLADVNGFGQFERKLALAAQRDASQQ